MRTSTITHCNRKATARFLHRLYPVPNPYDTQGEFERFFHIDLSDMPLDALRREARRVQYRLDLDEQPPLWLRERLWVVRQEVARHRKGYPHDPPPMLAEGTQRQAAVERQPATRHHTRGVPLNASNKKLRCPRAPLG